MRIEGHIDHPDCKITIFKMGTKYAVKFEQNLIEQTYKIREHPAFMNVQDVIEFCHSGLTKVALTRFSEMQSDFKSTLDHFLESGESDFEEII